MKAYNGKISHKGTKAHRTTDFQPDGSRHKEKRKEKSFLSILFFLLSSVPRTKSSMCLCVIILIPIIAMSACSRNTAQTGAQDPLAGQNQINRIISAAPSNTEIITGLGLGDRIIAIDQYSKGIPGLPDNLPEIDFFYPDTEAVIGLNPDIIFVNEINSFGVADNPFKLLGDLGIKVAEIRTSTSIEGIYGDILFIADALNVKERGEAMVMSLQAEIESITEAGKKTTGKKSVYFEVSAMPTMVSFGQGTYLDEMIEIAGGSNIFADQIGWFSPSAEEIINRNPDIIFTLLNHGVDPVSEILSRKVFEGVTAIREKQVFVIDADSAARPSQNIMTALREMAAAVNPSYYETSH